MAFSSIRPLVCLFIAVFYLAASFERNSFWQNEETIWNDALSKSPQKARPYLNVGTALTAENPDQVIPYFIKAAELDRFWYKPHYNLGIIYKKMGNAAEALAEFNSAIALNKKDYQSYNHIGVLYMEQGERVKAFEALQKSIELNDRYYQAYNNIGILYLSQGRLKDAEAAFIKCLNIHREYPEVHNYLAQIYLKIGRTDRAISHLLEAADARPDFLDAYISLGDVFREKGDLRRAVKIYSEGLKFHNTSAKLLNDAGISLARLGEFEKAAALLERAAIVDPHNREIRNNLTLARNMLDKMKRIHVLQDWHLLKYFSPLEADRQHRRLAPVVNLMEKGFVRIYERAVFTALSALSALHR